jgi:alpha-D-xyloside xylohydrolase
MLPSSDECGRTEVEMVSTFPAKVFLPNTLRYIVYGPTPKEVLQKYSILTGKPGKVPSWSYGLWLSTSFTTNYDENTVNSFLEGMKARDIPVEVFHFDCFWLRAFHWCDFVFDSEMFPDPKAQITRLKASGRLPYLGLTI